MADSKYYRLDAGGQSVSDDHPLPVTVIGAGGSGATLDDILAELQAQTALLTTIAANTAPE